MPTPRTLDDTYRYLHLDLPLSKVQCLSMNQLRDMVRQTWHFAVAAERARVKQENQTTEKFQSEAVMWGEAFDEISGRCRDDILWLGADWLVDELLRAMPDDCKRLDGDLVEQCEELAKAWIEAIEDAGKSA